MVTPPDHIEFLTPATLPPLPGFSQLVRVTGGQTIYIAGQVALDASGTLVGRGDFRAQAQQVFENINARELRVFRGRLRRRLVEFTALI